MRAAMFYGPNKMIVEESPFYHSENEATIKMDACAVCGYDARVFRNGHRKVKPPVILGHEICGQTLHEINTSKGVLSAGTRVVVLPTIPCLSCWYCNNQQYNLCNNLMEIGSTINGGFLEYVNIPQKNIKIGGIVPLPEKFLHEENTLLKPPAFFFNGFFRFCGIEKKGGVLIISD